MNTARLPPHAASPGRQFITHAALPPERVATRTSPNDLLPGASDLKSPTSFLIVGRRMLNGAVPHFDSQLP